jgi:hypothetical protein
MLDRQTVGIMLLDFIAAALTDDNDSFVIDSSIIKRASFYVEREANELYASNPDERYAVARANAINIICAELVLLNAIQAAIRLRDPDEPKITVDYDSDKKFTFTFFNYSYTANVLLVPWLKNGSIAWKASARVKELHASAKNGTPTIDFAIAAKVMLLADIVAPIAVIRSSAFVKYLVKSKYNSNEMLYQHKIRAADRPNDARIFNSRFFNDSSSDDKYHQHNHQILMLVKELLRESEDIPLIDNGLAADTTQCELIANLS